MNLDVLIPSLLLPVAMHKLVLPPVVPSLERLLARADRQFDVAPAGLSWLCERWGINAPYPIAPLLADYDGLDVSEDGWMLAEPVQLIPDRDVLKLVPGRLLNLTAAETAEFIAELNLYFSDRHLRFFAPTPDRWYVRCAPEEIPDTMPPSGARFGSLTEIQPRSTGSLDWRAIQNETQMLFFGHRINEVREATGKATVNGVWFWGGGVVPRLKKPGYESVISNSALAAQLAKKSAIDLQPLAWSSIQSRPGKVLVTIESCADFGCDGDLDGWRRELERLDQDWLLPLSQALRRGVIQRLRLYLPGEDFVQSFEITRRNQLLRFWRTAKPLASYA